MTSSDQQNGVYIQNNDVKNIILDFDGIFASDMIYTKDGKTGKTFPWGIRHSIDILTEHGFNVYIITGDSTGMGKAITAKFIENLKITEIIYCHSKDKVKLLKKKFDLSTCIYSGEDIYDLEIYRECFSIVPQDAHNILKANAVFVSKFTTRDYFFMDLAFNALHHFKYSSIEPNVMVSCITKDSTHETLSDFLCNLRYKNVLFLQQYSMRNHSDNTYNPLLDGNLNLTLHRIYKPLKNNKNLNIIITIPLNCNEDQKNLLIKFCDDLYGKDRVKFEEIRYGLNAEENRTALKSFGNGEDLSGLDLIVSDFSGVESLEQYKNVIYNFNISKNSISERWYVDKHFDDQYKTIIQNVTNGNYGLTYVLNDNQKEYMLSQGNELLINAGVIVDSKIMSAEILKYQQKYFIDTLDATSKQTIRVAIQNALEYTDLVLFMPFRLSDPCYNFKDLMEYLGKTDKLITLFITNPNDAEYEHPSNVNIIDLSKLCGETANKKGIYFFMLDVLNYVDVFIPVFEDPTEVIHQSIIEMYWLTTKCCFLDKNNFNYETLATASYKNNTNKYDKYLRSLIYE